MLVSPCSIKCFSVAFNPLEFICFQLKTAHTLHFGAEEFNLALWTNRKSTICYLIKTHTLSAIVLHLSSVTLGVTWSHFSDIKSLTATWNKVVPTRTRTINCIFNLRKCSMSQNSCGNNQEQRVHLLPQIPAFKTSSLLDLDRKN